jgi:hypothetical protein
LVIRISHPGTNAPEFPSNPEVMLDALRSGSPGLAKHEEITIDLTELGLNESITSNPVACAEIFSLLMDNVFTVLLGIEPAVRLHREDKKTVPLCGRKKGIFGRTTAGTQPDSAATIVYTCLHLQML